MYIRIPKKHILLFLVLVFSLFFVTIQYFMQYNKIITNEDKNKVVELQGKVEYYKNQITYKNNKIKELNIIHSSIKDFEIDLLKAQEFKITAYDLSYRSCGKTSRNKEFGITRAGFDLKGHTWKTSRVIAVDPNVIALGSMVYIQFIDEDYVKYSGLYKAMDTGSKIKGNRIDLFIEDVGDTKVSRKALQFGITQAKVIVL